MVFDNLLTTRNYTGYVFFLEEDHYVAPDFIQVAHQLIGLKKQKCSDCDFINVGMYNKAKVLNNRVSPSAMLSISLVPSCTHDGHMWRFSCCLM